MSRLRTLAHVALTAAVPRPRRRWAASASAAGGEGPPPQRPSPPRRVGSRSRPGPGFREAGAEAVHKVNPVYPAEAKAEGVQGIFLVNVIIGKDGPSRKPGSPLPPHVGAALGDQDREGKAKWTPADARGDARWPRRPSTR